MRKNTTYRAFQERLRAIAAAWFRGQDTSAAYPWSLKSKDLWHRNIILPEVAEYIEQERQNRHFALHDHVHNGLSSQAMAFNLLGPMLRSTPQDLRPLLTALQQARVPVPVGEVSAQFEFEDRAVFNEQQPQPTSVDVALFGTEDKPGFIAIECKLSENEYGGCSKASEIDCENPTTDYSRCHLHQTGRTYWPLLEKHGLISKWWADDTTCPLKSHYQFYRLVMLALERDGHFVLLYDERNPTFVFQDGDGTHDWLWLNLGRQCRNRVHAVTMQSVWKAAMALPEHKAWATQFGAKYGLLKT